jgi:outer membrane receptor protein involved in Fe transport
MLRLFTLVALLATFCFAQTTGSIVGSVLDGQTGQPLRGVQISVDGNQLEVRSDPDGRFNIRISPGTYKLRFVLDNYSETTIEQVEVKAGEATESSTVLTNRNLVTTVEVVEKVGSIGANAEAMLTERKLAAVVSDGMSSEDIRNSVASDAAGAVEKVTGVSIVDNGYVFVRGLGERYSSTMLNNAMIPTTEPEKRVVPLDLFPASLIDNIRVLKTYSPDLPGEFSGGVVQMRTVEFPTAKTLRVSVSSGFNSVTTGNAFGSFAGGNRDFFGFDSGARSLPASIPQEDRLFVGRFTDAQFQQFGRSFSPNWQLNPIGSMRPSQSYSVAGGNSYLKGKLGLVGALTFSNAPQRTQELQRYLRTGTGGRPIIFTNYDNFESSNESARLGGVLNAAYKVNDLNKLVWRNTITRDTDKEGRVFRGYNGGLDAEIEATRLRWVERSLFSTSVEGEHALPSLKNLLLTWQLTASRSSRDEPDLRETIRSRDDAGRFSFIPVPDSGIRLFSGLKDRIYEPLAEAGVPFVKGSVSGIFKVGFRGTFRNRDFAARRFRYAPVRSQTIDFFQPTNTVLGSDNIRPDGFVVREVTRGTDTYDADMSIYGGFAMVDLAVGARWRAVGGLRVEDADIRVTTIDPLVPGARPQQAQLKNRDPLPAINLIYALTSKQNLRFGWSRTVNRPDFRELSPFEFTNVLGGYSAAGNPNLLRAKITNYDARWEWFPGGDEVIAASYFFKDFTNPIESVFTPTTAELRQSFLNADGARNQGIELEYRQRLRRLNPRLKEFRAQANFTFVDSNVEIPLALAPQLTSAQRPLMGQSRYIYNLIGEWARPEWRSNARFYLNSVSRRLTEVGTFRLPDIYQERNLFMDFVYQYEVGEKNRWSVRFSAENLTNNQYRWTQSDITQRAFRIGRTFSVGASFSIF